MGVKGLWSLLNPVARPVQIESLEGKRLAIDSSIWLYQFQSTMRDKDGRVLTNAHVLGFLRRINKLLFHGIKPVFVFDGGAPALKRSTIAERKRRKQGAAINHAKMAEKLLHAQMRREAVRLAERAEDDRSARVAARYNDEVSEAIPANTVYLDQLEGRAGPSQPRKVAASASAPGAIESSGNKKKYKKDRYELPDATIPAFTTAEAPDARLATEAELQQFINDVNPEDIDIESPEFRALPTEVQYEIIGDLRLRSRQQSHARLTEMLRAAPTSLDFSKAQIKHLSQRNALTQQLLTVTDMVGKAHLTIPVRVAAERNREYVLVKRGETEGGGWALGIREGTKDKPIVLEPESPVRGKKEVVEEETTDSEYDSDLEPMLPPPPDNDLRQNRRREILSAIAQRYAPTHSKPSLDVEVKSFGKRRQPGTIPLFDLAEEDADVPDLADIEPTANDEALALALQQEELGSDEEEADPDLARALALSRREAEVKGIHAPVADGDGSDSDQFEEVSLEPSARTTPVAEEVLEVLDSEDDGDDEIEITGVKTVSHNPIQVVRDKVVPISPVRDKVKPTTSLVRATVSAPVVAAARLDSSEDEFEEVDVVDALPTPVGPSGSSGRGVASESSSRPSRLAALVAASRPVPVVPPSPEEVSFSPPPVPESAAAVSEPSPPPVVARSPSPVAPSPLDASSEAPSPPRGRGAPSSSPERRPPSPAPFRGAPSPSPPCILPGQDEPMHIDSDDEMQEMEETQLNIPEPTRRASPEYSEDEEDPDEPIEWSRSPTPQPGPQLMSRAASGHSAHSLMSEPEQDDDDDEDGGEMAPADMVAEEDDYARFLAQIKNRDLREVRSEIDNEIAVLNQQTKAAMRDSDEITQSMIVQIQTLLRHFGIPYITAPMEAEAQCAKLAQLDLVDGIITDDSDVFLFGGTQCFKNIFNDAKFAECFLATDVERELSLTRDRLISLAYLLGSDYDVGLLGVGPVLALELLAEFPGADGLQRFKEWWLKVQSGTDLPVESDSKWKRGFKKRFAGSIHLGAEWPNAHVREAYLHPTTDESDEPFHWGFPRLHALRTFLHEELSWSISKVDDELTPIVQRIAKRGRGGEIKQGTLLSFFDHGAGTGASYAPRRRATANISKRLMAVIKTFREAEALAQGQQPGGWGEMLAGVDENDPKGVGVKERKKSGKEAKGKGKEKAKATGKTATRKRKSKDVVEDEADDEEADELDAEAEERPRTRRRRTRSTAESDDVELVE